MLTRKSELRAELLFYLLNLMFGDVLFGVASWFAKNSHWGLLFIAVRDNNVKQEADVRNLK